MSKEPLRRETFQRDWAGILILFAAVVFLSAAIFLFDPFAKAITTSKQSLANLNTAQRENISIAAAAIDGTILLPHSTFSFNAVCGPRTPRRGYTKARSYMGDDSPNTFGGGICLLSSALYRLALKADLRIVQRQAHTRPIASVAPGYDATVSTDGPDLRFANDYAYPLRLHTNIDDNTLEVMLQAGATVAPITEPNFVRQVQRADRGLTVSVLKNQDGKVLLVSRDTYVLPLLSKHANRVAN